MKEIKCRIIISSLDLFAFKNSDEIREFVLSDLTHKIAHEIKNHVTLKNYIDRFNDDTVFTTRIFLSSREEVAELSRLRERVIEEEHWKKKFEDLEKKSNEAIVELTLERDAYKKAFLVEFKINSKD